MLKLLVEQRGRWQVGKLVVVTSSEKEELKTYSDDELMTIKEAYPELKICRNTLDKLRRNKKLTSIFKKRNVRLIHAEVGVAMNWYSLIEGK